MTFSYPKSLRRRLIKLPISSIGFNCLLLVSNNLRYVLRISLLLEYMHNFEKQELTSNSVGYWPPLFLCKGSDSFPFSIKSVLANVLFSISIAWKYVSLLAFRKFSRLKVSSAVSGAHLFSKCFWMKKTTPPKRTTCKMKHERMLAINSGVNILFIFSPNANHQPPGHWPKTENKKATFPVGLDEFVSTGFSS